MSGGQRQVAGQAPAAAARGGWWRSAPTWRRTLVVLAVLALLQVALYALGRDSGDAGTEPQLQRLRSAAALAPCPPGLSPDLPDLVLPCVGTEGQVDVQAAPGTPLLVNVWATWCPPCVREVPLLQDLHARTDALDVVGVLTQDTVENGLQFAEDATLGFDMTYASVLDEQGTVMRRYGSGPPITLFVTAQGEVAHVQRGEMTSQEQLDGLVEQHLGLDL